MVMIMMMASPLLGASWWRAGQRFRTGGYIGKLCNQALAVNDRPSDPCRNSAK